MPFYVLDRINEILINHPNINKNKIGFYGLTYKENVDDIRESPTLQLIHNTNIKNLFYPITFDPFVKIPITNNQVFSFSKFLSEIDLIVIMVKHQHLIDNIDLIKDKYILDTQNICFFEDVYKL
jgi:UDP-N-acetyl-D-mannosaminuronic acid dehydrogenase